MKKIAFSLALLGIFILLLILTYSKPILINTSTNISLLETNQKISLSGKVTAQNSDKLTIDNSLDVYCSCSSKYYLNKNISLLGYIDNFYNQKRITALKIKEN